MITCEDVKLKSQGVIQVSQGKRLRFSRCYGIKKYLLGMSLVELLVVIAIIGIIAGITVSNMDINASRMRSETLNFKAALMRAQSEAIKRNNNVTFKYDTSSYNATTDNGIVVFTGSLGSGCILDETPGSIGFSCLGWATNMGFMGFDIKRQSKLCKIIVRSSGRIYIDGKCPQ